MKFLYNVIYVLILFCFSCNLKAQTVKQIEVAGNAPYVDHISLYPIGSFSFSKITYATHMLSAFVNSAPTDCPTWWNRMKRQDTK